MDTNIEAAVSDLRGKAAQIDAAQAAIKESIVGLLKQSRELKAAADTHAAIASAHEDHARTLATAAAELRAQGELLRTAGESVAAILTTLSQHVLNMDRQVSEVERNTQILAELAKR